MIFEAGDALCSCKQTAVISDVKYGNPNAGKHYDVC
jgi:hypothetical protein